MRGGEQGGERGWGGAGLSPLLLHVSTVGSLGTVSVTVLWALSL